MVSHVVGVVVTKVRVQHWKLMVLGLLSTHQPPGISVYVYVCMYVCVCMCVRDVCPCACVCARVRV